MDRPGYRSSRGLNAYLLPQKDSSPLCRRLLHIQVLNSGLEGMPVKSRYLLFQKAEAALIEEKSGKLFGITKLLDLHLEGDFDDALLSVAGRSAVIAPRLDRIRILNKCLAPFTDQIAAAFPGVGVGYYSRDLRAILTYGPSCDFDSKVGADLGTDHLGWQAMETSKETVAVGSMVRGEIMNCMRPLIRQGKAIGFVWANEALEDIYAQIQLGAGKLFFSPETEPLLGLTGILLFASKVLLLGRPRSDSVSSAMAPQSPTPQSADSQIAHKVAQLKCYLELFLNTLSLAVVLSDACDRITFVSRGIQDILGLTPASLVSRDIRGVLQSLGIDPRAALDEFADGSLNRFVNVTVKTREGDRCITMVSTRAEWPAPALGPTTASGHIIILENLKEAHANEERLERAERLAAVGELAAAVAHEIRNPLAVLKGAVSLVPARLDDREFLEQFSQVAAAEMDRINGTVESLLRFSRYSQPHLVATDIRQVVERACNLISEYCREMGIDIECSCPRDVPPLCCDGDHLTQALLNLLLNGVQAMAAGGVLRVEVTWKPGARPGASYVQIAVADTGAGIPPKLRDHVFDMFFTTKESGTGLGLPLVQRIIYNHQGFVEFESETGKGSTFTVKLPVVAENRGEKR